MLCNHSSTQVVRAPVRTVQQDMGKQDMGKVRSNSLEAQKVALQYIPGA